MIAQKRFQDWGRERSEEQTAKALAAGRKSTPDAGRSAKASTGQKFVQSDIYYVSEHPLKTLSDFNATSLLHRFYAEHTRMSSSLSQSVH